MRTKTELEKIKQAIIKISEATKFKVVGGMVIIHPLLHNVFITKGDKIEMIDRKNFKEKVQEACTNLRKAKTLEHVFMLIRKPDRLLILDYCKSLMTVKDFNWFLREAWVSVESPHQYGVQKLIKLFDNSKPELLMTKQDLKEFNELPDSFTVYRGIQDDKSVVKGLSWTTSLSTAVWFGNRFGKGKVFQAEIAKSSVYAFFSDRNELEVVLNPYKLRKMKVLTEEFENGNKKK